MSTYLFLELYEGVDCTPFTGQKSKVKSPGGRLATIEGGFLCMAESFRVSSSSMSAGRWRLAPSDRARSARSLGLRRRRYRYGAVNLRHGARMHLLPRSCPRLLPQHPSCKSA